MVGIAYQYAYYRYSLLFAMLSHYVQPREVQARVDGKPDRMRVLFFRKIGG